MLHDDLLSLVHLRDHGLSLDDFEFSVSLLKELLDLSLVGDVLGGSESIAGAPQCILSEVVCGKAAAVAEQASVEGDCFLWC